MQDALLLCQCLQLLTEYTQFAFNPQQADLLHVTIGFAMLEHCHEPLLSCGPPHTWTDMVSLAFVKLLQFQTVCMLKARKVSSFAHVAASMHAFGCKFSDYHQRCTDEHVCQQHPQIDICSLFTSMVPSQRHSKRACSVTLAIVSDVGHVTSCHASCSYECYCI